MSNELPQTPDDDVSNQIEKLEQQHSELNESAEAFLRMTNDDPATASKPLEILEQTSPSTDLRYTPLSWKLPAWAKVGIGFAIALGALIMGQDAARNNASQTTTPADKYSAITSNNVSGKASVPSSSDTGTRAPSSSSHNNVKQTDKYDTVTYSNVSGSAAAPAAVGTAAGNAGNEIAGKGGNALNSGLFWTLIGIISAWVAARSRAWWNNPYIQGLLTKLGEYAHALGWNVGSRQEGDISPSGSANSTVEWVMPKLKQGVDGSWRWWRGWMAKKFPGTGAAQDHPSVGQILADGKTLSLWLWYWGCAQFKNLSAPSGSTTGVEIKPKGGLSSITPLSLVPPISNDHLMPQSSHFVSETKSPHIEKLQSKPDLAGSNADAAVTANDRTIAQPSGGGPTLASPAPDETAAPVTSGTPTKDQSTIPVKGTRLAATPVAEQGPQYEARQALAEAESPRTGEHKDMPLDSSKAGSVYKDRKHDNTVNYAAKQAGSGVSVVAEEVSEDRVEPEFKTEPTAQPGANRQEAAVPVGVKADDSAVAASVAIPALKIGEDKADNKPAESLSANAANTADAFGTTSTREEISRTPDEETTIQAKSTAISSIWDDQAVTPAVSDAIISAKAVYTSSPTADRDTASPGYEIADEPQVAEEGGFGKILPWLAALAALVILPWWYFNREQSAVVNNTAGYISPAPEKRVETDSLRVGNTPDKPPAASAPSTPADTATPAATVPSAPVATEPAEKTRPSPSTASSGKVKVVMLPGGKKIEVVSGSILERFYDLKSDPNADTGKAIRVEGLNFVTGSAKIRPDSASIVEQIVQAMLAYPTLAIRIEGHTDNVGNPHNNSQLSAARALALKTALIRKGIAQNRIETRGFGQDVPIASNDTETGRAQNRRVQVLITRK